VNGRALAELRKLRDKLLDDSLEHPYSYNTQHDVAQGFCRGLEEAATRIDALIEELTREVHPI
jgi:hypothetical protein